VQAFPLLPMVGSIEKIAFRPWRNKFEVYDFYLTEMTQDVPLGAAAASAKVGDCAAAASVELADGAKAAMREEVPLLDTKFNWPYDPLAPSKIQQWENAAAAYQPGEIIVALADFNSSSDPRAGQRALIDVAKGDWGRVIRSDPVYGVFVLFAKDPSRDHQISPELFDKIQKAPELLDNVQKEVAPPPPEAPKGAAGAQAASAAREEERKGKTPAACVHVAPGTYVISHQKGVFFANDERDGDGDVKWRCGEPSGAQDHLTIKSVSHDGWFQLFREGTNDYVFSQIRGDKDGDFKLWCGPARPKFEDLSFWGCRSVDGGCLLFNKAHPDLPAFVGAYKGQQHKQLSLIGPDRKATRNWGQIVQFQKVDI
jgi:hypothetical protein